MTFISANHTEGVRWAEAEKTKIKSKLLEKAEKYHHICNFLGSFLAAVLGRLCQYSQYRFLLVLNYLFITYCS